MWRRLNTNCPLQTPRDQHLHSRTALTWLCCIPANNTPEMIDPFLVPPTERVPQGSPSFPRYRARIPRRSPFYNEHVDVLQARPKKLGRSQVHHVPSRWGESGEICTVSQTERQSKDTQLGQTTQLLVGCLPRHAGCDSYVLPSTTHTFSYTPTLTQVKRKGVKGSWRQWRNFPCHPVRTRWGQTGQVCPRRI
jgi:hypothetical protein